MEVDPAVAVVWVDVRPDDGAAQADRAARLFENLPVKALRDSGQQVARAFARGLGIRGIAWDVYLLYEPGAKWRELVPPPTAWFHQLDGDCAEASKHRAGHELLFALRAAARAAGSPASAIGATERLDVDRRGGIE